MSSNRPGRWFRRLIVTLVVLAVLAIAVDRIAAVVAQNQLASMATKEAAKYDVRSADTSVKIGGFGFFPQLFKEDFSKVTLTMEKPTLTKIPGENLTVDMHSVHVPRSLLTQQSGAVTIDTTNLRLQFAPRELGRLAVAATDLQGLSLVVVDGKLHAKLTLGGSSADVPITPKISNGRMALAVDQLPDGIPAVLRTALQNRLADGIEIPKLPFGAQVTGVSIEDNSVVLTAAVQDLKFNS
ncbi:LmeA family phospholipid-binding protein [Kribbella kalugense]|uniref:DUF2993 family protein n=1 Tax=Kribbella kalugense TaxID=2512221 RepID=A0A4R7ZFM3_9ACTN|nr:DUF2993 domain-containing protein [Kribbella kalugense]TDW15796.1 DUF2993 family protein [Kribbella kalugense]